MKRIVILLSALLFVFSANAQQVDPCVKKVHVIFKTHLDIGFTELSSKVEQRYIDEFIPKAIAVADALREDGGKDRYVWTTGAWLVKAYLEQATPDAARRLEEAIRCGDIVWNGVPYTVESEAMNRELFAGMLKLSHQLDTRFGKKTTAAKMTDVPGHTRGIIPLLADAGISFLQIGVNSAATVPAVPPVCLWRDQASGKEVVLMYQKSYGEDMILPGGEVAVSINFTNDNKGPHTIQRVKTIFSTLRKRYPNAQIEASSLNAVAEDLQSLRATLPVLTSEIGDTWIYGYGSSPMRMAQYRELSRLYAAWLRDGRLTADSPEAVNFAIRLGMIAEHTWGADVKVFLKNWDKYDVDAFRAARNEAQFRYMERSWAELDANIPKAIALLPAGLRIEAEQAVATIAKVDYTPVVKHDNARNLNLNGSYEFAYKGVRCTFGQIAYQSFSAADYTRFHNAYLTKKPQWAIEDNGKPGLDQGASHSVTIEAQVEACAVEKGVAGREITAQLCFPTTDKVDARVLPAGMQSRYTVAPDGRSIEMVVTIDRKPANRMPEAYWLSICPEKLVGIVAEKVGARVDLMDVVEGGNRQMHSIDGWVDLITQKGTLRLYSHDAPLIAVGERNALNYSTVQPDMNKGVYVCLFNNLWGTNFSMWWEGSISYRFRIEVL